MQYHIPIISREISLLCCKVLTKQLIFDHEKYIGMPLRTEYYVTHMETFDDTIKRQRKTGSHKTSKINQTTHKNEFL